MPKIEQKDLANIAEMSSSQGYFAHKIRDPHFLESGSYAGKNPWKLKLTEVRPSEVVRALDSALLQATRESALSLIEMAMYGDSKLSAADADKLLTKVTEELSKGGSLGDVQKLAKKWFQERMPIFLHTHLSDEEYEEESENWCDKLDLDPEYALSAVRELCEACGEPLKGIDFGFHKGVGLICDKCLK